jgi:tetratricopeptide (TPR) repeat protein
MIPSVPELNEHTVAPPALRPLDGQRELEARLSEICRLPSARPRALATLGNVLLRRGAYVDALEAYRSAAQLDPSDAPVHWMCAEVAHVLGDAETSDTFRKRALAQQRVYPDPMPLDGRTAVLLLLRDIPYSTNTPLELILDRKRIAVHKYYLEGTTDVELPAYDVVFTGFGAARAASHAIARAADFAGAAINDPRRLPGTGREALARTLEGIDGVVAPEVTIVPAGDVRSIARPALVRPVDTHAGEGLVHAVDGEDLARLIERHPAQAYYRSSFVDYRSADGYYRKFRVIFVGDRAFPYHLAISPHWMVHYQTAPMEDDPALRAQEAAFLDAPQTLVPRWSEIMSSIARAVGLDYFGIDAAVLPDGTVFVFEADAAMLVHDEDARGPFAYKRPHVARIREALHELIADRSLDQLR